MEPWYVVSLVVNVILVDILKSRTENLMNN